MEKHDKALPLVGLLFLIWGVSALILGINDANPSIIFWLCYSSLILIGISILKKDSYLLVSQLNILTLPMILWTIDFVFYLLNGHSIFGIVDYFFQDSPNLAKIISLQHIFTLPLSFYALHKLKVKTNNSWMASFFQMIIIFILGRTYSSVAANVNCVYEPCVNLTLDAQAYYILWFLVSFIVVIGTNQIINKIKAFKE